MENITHRKIPTNGIHLHVAEIGDGPAVVFLHGFPELWYSWRHQMLYLASRGYRAIAPDLRGYGDSDAPPSPSTYTFFHLVGDMVGLLDALGLAQVYLVGHDWGAIVAWYWAMFRPDMIKALVNMSVVFQPRDPSKKPLDSLGALMGDDFYICQFQEPGVAEEKFAEIGTIEAFKKLLTLRDPSPPQFSEVFKGPEVSELPPWLSHDDILHYATKFDQTGFTGGLNYYRALDLNWELTAAWTGAHIKVPVLFITGDLDITFALPGVKEFICEGGLKELVPSLEEVVIMEGVAHFLNQEKPQEINDLIYNFIHKF